MERMMARPGTGRGWPCGAGSRRPRGGSTRAGGSVLQHFSCQKNTSLPNISPEGGGGKQTYCRAGEWCWRA